ncbi:MAG: hypothetical protein ACQEP8_06335, partial [Chlamydiota bacterium]
MQNNLLRPFPACALSRLATFFNPQPLTQPTNYVMIVDNFSLSAKMFFSNPEVTEGVEAELILGSTTHPNLQSLFRIAVRTLDTDHLERKTLDDTEQKNYRPLSLEIDGACQTVLVKVDSIAQELGISSQSILEAADTPQEPWSYESGIATGKLVTSHIAAISQNIYSQQQKAVKVLEPLASHQNYENSCRKICSLLRRSPLLFSQPSNLKI